MKSRITAEINFDDNNRPCIKISPWKSEDVRDSIVENLISSIRLTGGLTADFEESFVRPDGTRYQDVILTPAFRPGIKFTNDEITELAEDALDDGQSIRPFWNYLSKTFDGIKGKEFEFEQITFNEPEVFYEHLIDVLKMMIESIRNEKNTQNA